MDFDALKRDLKKALKLVPPGLIDFKVVAERIYKHRSQLDKVVPEMIEILQPHIGAAVAEAGFGILDKDELEKTALSVMEEMGVNVAESGR